MPDHAQYADVQMPMPQQRQGGACHGCSVDKGTSRAAPGSAPCYIAMCQVCCDSVEAVRTAFSPHMRGVMGDAENYTNVAPQWQFSEVELR